MPQLTFSALERVCELPAWDGVDFSLCFRNRVLDGAIPAAILAVSLAATVLLALIHLAVLLDRSPAARAAAAAAAATSASPIAEAEGAILRAVVESESPDLKVGGRAAAKREGYQTVESSEDGRYTPVEAVSGWLLLRTVAQVKRDLFNVIGTGALLALVVCKYTLGSQDTRGGAWLVWPVALSAWMGLLSLVKLAIGYSSALHALQDPASLLQRSRGYQFWEKHTITFFLLQSAVQFLLARSAILHYIASHSEVAYRNLVLEGAKFVVLSLLLNVEILSPRPSVFPSSSNTLDKDGNELPPSPEINACLLSQATFTFIEGFMRSMAVNGRGYYTMAKVPDLRPDDKTARVALAFRSQTASLSANSSLIWQLVWFFKGPLAVQNFWAWVRVSVIALPPLFLKLILGHITMRQRGEEAPFEVAVLFALGMLVTQVVAGLAASQSLYIGRRMCIQIRSIIITEVFTKALRRKDQAGKSKTPGDEKVKTEEEAEKANEGRVMNLLSVDTFRLSEVAGYLHFIFPELSLTILITLTLLYRVLGPSAIAGVAVLIAITPLQAAASRYFYVYQQKLLTAADERLAGASEIVAGIRLVKQEAWEKPFLARQAAVREKELDALWYRGVTMVVSGILMFGAPVLVSVATFVCHTKFLKQDLTAETAFTALALFNLLRGPLEGFTDMIVNVLQALVSLKRIDEFLSEQESAKYSIVRSPTIATDPVVGFKDATFTWADEASALADSSIFRIKDLTLSFPVGKLSLITGPVGCGKTTLLLSLLGETNLLGSGSSFLPSPVVRVTGEDPSILAETSAYCSQTPWLLSDSIRSNILFGLPYNEERYQTVLEVCALKPDLETMRAGDGEEVGERGSVLSGGQKARIALARAVYSSARYILLDDVLSAVDSHTAQHIYSRCLLGEIMRHRTVILVTHAVDLCLPGAAFVVAMEHGEVISATSPSSSRVDLARIADANESAIAIAHDEDLAVQEAKTHVAETLVKEETQSEGAVSLDVYRTYMKGFGGASAVLVALLIFLLAQLSEIGVNLALRYWAGSYDDNQESVLVTRTMHAALSAYRRAPVVLSSFISFAPSANAAPSPSPASMLGTGNAETDYWLWMYVVLGSINLFFYGARVGFFLWRGIAASRQIYVLLIVRVMAAPIRFFSQTPQGRILNRLSKDMETVDQDLAMTLMFLLLELFGVVGIIATISAVLPSFLFAGFIIFLAYWAIGYVYLASSRELKRSESVTRSPIFSAFGEVLQGVASIRAYGDSGCFTQRIVQLLNINNRPFFALWQTNRWLSVRVDIAGALVSFAATMFVLLSPSSDAALAGFIISFAISFNERILWVVRLWAMNELNMNSVERVREFMDLDSESPTGTPPPAIWPSTDGSIEVKGLTAGYAPELPSILQGVTFSVAPREKIGICGRTGSGKSSLALCLLRFIQARSGSIVIDGIDISTIPLFDLRSRLTIVSQDAYLFAATLRFNLDPLGVHEDAALWDSLRRVQLASSSRTPAPSRPGSPVESPFAVTSLEMMVTEGGKNFSVGQRQLLSLARGILKLSTSSILILDESTASLDQGTDEKIQRTIRDEMSNATILCIAHRLRTIVDYDKILVLGAGEVLEYDTPWNLLDKDDSEFSQLCRKSGEYDELVAIANSKRPQVAKR